MAEIVLEPIEGGNSVSVPDTKTVIGRGPFLEVQLYTFTSGIILSDCPQKLFV